ncbi:MAG: hypothetical protein AAGE59_23880 [Cyanobacteria bacterium P01_F01_bin.86]
MDKISGQVTVDATSAAPKDAKGGWGWVPWVVSPTGGEFRWTGGVLTHATQGVFWG